MSTPNNRSRGIVAVIEGVFAFMWFGWGQAEAPSWLTVPLLVGSAAGLAVALLGGLVALRATGQRSPMADPGVRRRYNLIVGVEVALILAGALALAAAGLTAWTPVWVCAVVGLHFIPLARVFSGLFLVPLAGGMVVVALGALVVGLVTSISPSTIAGPGAGICLVFAAAATLLSSGPHKAATGRPAVNLTRS